jgi:hypothetical protein
MMDSPPITESDTAKSDGSPRPSVELLRILGDALHRASGVLGSGVEDLRHQLGPIWDDLTAGIGAKDLTRKLDEITRLILQVELSTRDFTDSQRSTLRQILEEQAGKSAPSKPDDTFLFAQFQEMGDNLKRIEQALRRPDEGARGAAARGSPAPSRGRETGPPAAREADAEQAAALAKLREELETARARAHEYEAAARKSQNEKIAYQNDLRQAREELGRWRLAALGEELSGDPPCQASCDDLIRDHLGGQAAATSLLGHWMTFRTVTPDRLPPLLRQVGESYYAWRPRVQIATIEDDPMESALVRALHTRCERNGVRNKIEVLRPGARFDSSRHETDGGLGGTTVVEVRGWLVLKGDGGVLYRAKVAAR